MTDRREQIYDEWLVLQCREGQREAFQELVTRWQPRLYRHARRLTGRDDAAWDVMQETWLAVAKGLSKLQEIRAFRRWIYSIVTRRASDLQRKRRLDEEHFDLEAHGDDDTAEDFPPPTDDVSSVREALSRLPGERHALLSLRYLEGFELCEIAEILKIPEGTVKSRLHHARAHLRQILERIDGKATNSNSPSN